MNNRKPEPARAWDHPERTYRWTDAELAWIAKRDAQWAAWGYSLAPLTPAPEPVRERAAWGPYLWAFAAAVACVVLAGWLVGLALVARLS